MKRIKENNQEKVYMQASYNNNDEIDLLYCWTVIKKRKKIIGLLVSVIVALTGIWSLVAPKYYHAEAVIMSIGNNGGSGGGLGQLGGLVAMAGGIASQTPAQQFLVFLRSRTLAEEIIKEHNLMKVLFSDDGEEPISMDRAVTSLLNSHVQFVDDKRSGVIKISVELTDPKLAADLANGYVEGLQKFINKNALTMAKRNRLFIENRLANSKRELLEAGKKLNEFYKEGNVSNLDSRIDVPVEGKLNFEGGEKQLAQLEQEKNNVTDFLAEAQSQSGVVKNVPQQVFFQYLTLQRSLLSQINTTLSQYYESAKIEEARDELSFQVIDSAKVPESRSRPKRKQMMMMAFLGSLFVGIVVAVFLEHIEKMRQQRL